jgi:hypothetical protein
MGRGRKKPHTNGHPRPTALDDIAEPTPLHREPTDVTLPFLRTKAGEPVTVHVVPIEELDLIEAMATTPGHQPPTPEDMVEADPQRGPSGLQRAWKLYEPHAEALIALGVSPAVPYAWLRDSERLALVMAILNASGWFGGPADQVARFPDVDDVGAVVRAGGSAAGASGAGDGAVAADDGGGAAPVAAVPVADGDER